MPNTATYILVLHLPADALLSIASLGDIEFPGGFYAYVGTAANSDLLVDVLKRHLSPIQTPRNDIEGFQQMAQIVEIWLSAKQMPKRNDLVDLLLAMPGSMSLIEGFGGADIDSEWDSYLIYFDVRPMLEDFSIGYKLQFPEDLIIRAYGRPETPPDEVAVD